MPIFAIIMTDNKDFLQLIKVIRFPLICLVVLSHSSLFIFPEIDVRDFSSENIYTFVTQLFSHNLAKLAVCTFFFISGFLFFRKVGTMTADWYKNKCKNRIHTLLIPYLSWNIIIVAVTYSLEYLMVLCGIKTSPDVAEVNMNTVLNWFITPADFPLWFMRDLMIMVILSPVVYYLVTRLKTVSAVLLLLLYLSPLSPQILTIRAIFFFSIGAYFSLRGIDVMTFCRKRKTIFAVIAALTLLLAAIKNGTAHHELYLRLFYPFGMITFANIIDILTRKNEKLEAKLEKLAESVFFIYAAHEIYILGWTKGLLLRLFGDNLTGMYLKFFLTPIIVVLVCIVLHKILKKIMPKTLAFLCGSR